MSSKFELLVKKDSEVEIFPTAIFNQKYYVAILAKKNLGL